MHTQKTQTETVGFELHSSFPPAMFKRPNTRPTITVLPIYEGKLCLVRPKQAPSTSWWVLPQGAILPGDGTIAMAVLREMEKDLGITPAHLSGHRMKPLGLFENTIPKDRVGGGITKVHYVVGVPVLRTDTLRLNRDKNASMAWVCNPRTFESMTSPVLEERPVKYGGMCRALKRAHEARLIPWTIH